MSTESDIILDSLKTDLLEELDTFRKNEIDAGVTIAVEANGHWYGIFSTCGMTRAQVEAEINNARDLRDLDAPEMQPGA